MVSSIEDRRRVKEMFREWDALVEPLTTPIVYHPGGWVDTVPDELKREVIRQRLEKQANGGWEEATDAEVMCYLMTCSLVQPLTRDWTDIFLYQGALFMPQIRDAIPDTPKELTDYQKSELGDLKRKIRASQIRQRKQSRKGGPMSKRKLVIEEREGSVLMGFQQEGCDPVLRTVEGNFDEALAQVPQLLTEAQEKWAAAPRNPKYTPPAPARKAATATTTPAAAPQTADALPLLAGTGKPAEPEAAAPAPAQTGIVEAVTPAPVEETTAPVEGETQQEDLAPATSEAETPPTSLEPTPTQEPETSTEEESTEAISQRIAAAPAPAGADAAGKPEWEYYLQDDRGPFSDIQAAMDAMGLDKETRPHHQRWDRLSTQLKTQIQRRAKAEKAS